ncbi:MAG: response regulator [Planctomycetota bacterium]
MPDEAQILLVEDNPALLRVTSFALQRSGLLVDEARDGQFALDKMRERQYGLVITDQQMPRLCGTDLLREARRLPGYETTPMVLLTAKALELSRDELAEQLSVHHVLRKPFSPVEVSTLAKELLSVAV